MAAVLKNTIAIVALAPGVPTVFAHGLLNALDVGTIPDILYLGDPDLAFIAADATNVTLRNDGPIAITTSVLVEHWHSTPRALLPGLTALTPQPVVVGGLGAGGAFTLSFQRTIAQPADGSDFVVVMPVAMPDDTYVIMSSLVDVVGHFTMSMPDALAGDRTALQFRVITSADPANGDVIEFNVRNR